MIKRIENPFTEWCAEVIASNNFVILDTETTGLKRHDQIIELAIVATTGEILYDRLMQPSCAISEGAFASHKITEAMLEDKRCFKEEWPEIEQAIAGRSIITYNAEFDSRMIRQSAIAHNVILPIGSWICAMREYAQFWGAPSRQGVWLGSQQLSGNAPFQKLEVACQQQGIDFTQEHRALGDTRATLEIIRKAAELGDKAPTYHTRKREWYE